MHYPAIHLKIRQVTRKLGQTAILNTVGTDAQEPVDWMCEVAPVLSWELPSTGCANAASITLTAPMSGMCASAGPRSNPSFSAICSTASILPFAWRLHHSWNWFAKLLRTYGYVRPH